MKRENFTFDSRDNKTKLHAVRWEPDSAEKPKAVLQIVHGMSEHVDRYEAFARFLTDNGVAVTAEDHLGHGKSMTQNGPGYFCKQDPATVVVRDVHRLKKITEEKYPGVPYYILGHSLGSFIVRNYLFRYGKGITGAIILGTGMLPNFMVAFLWLMSILGCLTGHASRPSTFISKIAFGSYLKKIENPKSDWDWLTKDDAVVKAYMEDSMCGFLFPCNGFKTMADLMLRLERKKNIEKMPVSLRVLISSGSVDPVGDYGKGPTRVYKQFIAEGMQRVTFKLYEGDRHEILNETDRETVYNDLLGWIVNEE